MEIDAITKAIHEHHNTMREQVVAGFIEKARSRTGRYANTSKNRKLGRVGALYTGRTKFEYVVAEPAKVWTEENNASPSETVVFTVSPSRF